MTEMIFRADGWVTTLVLFALMTASWAIGLTIGRHLARRGREPTDSKLGEASLGLMALLLAFTFAMALEKHGHRREMVVSDADAIGDFYTTVSLLKEPARSQLQAAVREYAHYRLELTTHSIWDEADFNESVARTNAMTARMTALVRDAADAGTPVVEPLVDTLNSLISSNATRQAAVRDHLPGPIVFLLALSTLISLALLGCDQGIARKRQYASTITFMLMIVAVLYIVLDLNQSRRGLLRVTQEPLERRVRAIDQ
jgi:hypothetical protein